MECMAMKGYKWGFGNQARRNVGWVTGENCQACDAYQNQQWIPNEVVQDPPLDKSEILLLPKFSILVTILGNHATMQISERRKSQELFIQKNVGSHNLFLHFYLMSFWVVIEFIWGLLSISSALMFPFLSLLFAIKTVLSANKWARKSFLVNKSTLFPVSFYDRSSIWSLLHSIQIFYDFFIINKST